ncbi:hypothetical protein JCM11251_001056 [Rhodosporidiobolus azoricus]
MDDSWSWDGSVISLTSSSPSPHSSSTPSPAARSRIASTRSLQDSGQLDASAESSSPSVDSVAPGITPTAQPPPLVEPFRPSPTSLASSSPSASSPTHIDAPSPPEPHRDHSHPLASFLLAGHSQGLSPPPSPAGSTSSSFPGSRARLFSAGGVQRGRGRGRGRAGSASSTVSTDGSAHEGESLASGEMSSGEDEHYHDGAGGAGGLVMPSMHLGSGADACDTQGKPSTRFFNEELLAKKVKILLLGKNEDERRTLATLLSHDDDLRRATSGQSMADLNYSFLSTRPSERSHSSGQAEEAEQAQAAAPSSALTHLQLISPSTASVSSPSFAFIDLYQPASSIETDVFRLATELLRPLEKLEAKLDRTYPSTYGLFDLVEKAGCGEFEAAFFLFSSPPTSAEIALARPLSHLIPLYPVLILPPSPTGKPQKTYALEQAVQEQLDKAGVRWVPLLPGRAGRKGRDGKGRVELCLLPHDLFVHHAPAHECSAGDPASAPSSSPAGVSAPTSACSTQPSSPASEGSPPSRNAPTSLTASQELPPTPHTRPASPHSPAFTGVSSSFRSLSSSFTGTSLPSVASSSSARSASLTSSRSSSHHRRASSHRRSRSRRSGTDQQRDSTSLHSLYVLQALIHSPSTPGELRKERAKQFLEWREVEVAARGARVKVVEELSREWEEKAFDAREGEAETGGRREIDFSKRVAERRRALALAVKGVDERGEQRRPEYGADDDDVLASSDEEDADADGAAVDCHIGHPLTGSTARNSFSYSCSSTMDPTTPRVSYRPLAVCPAFDGDPAASSTLAFGSGSGYFPPFPPPPSSDDAPALSASFTSSSSRSGTSSNGMTAASSILLLPGAPSDPFHLPSLLHLVGLNLRLAVFSPSFAAATPPPARACDADETVAEEKPAYRKEEARRKGGFGWGAWVGAAAVVGLFFAAGVAVGAQAGDGGAFGGQERWWSITGR